MQNSLFINTNGCLIDLSHPKVMAIINITPDSFYTHSRFRTDAEILNAVENALNQGATILDIGGYSTRPSACEITSDDELKRLEPAIELIVNNFNDCVISVDTFRSCVAKRLVNSYKVAIINDISGGTLDPEMFRTIAELKVAYVLMHIKGTPQTMQQNCTYEHVTAEVLNFLQSRLSELRQLGVNDVIVDPGFGFAKNLEQNYQLLNNLSCLSSLNAPILAGVSRKSMIHKLLDCTPELALNGTSAVNMLALLGGANILRVHDVKEAMEVIKIFQYYSATKL